MNAFITMMDIYNEIKSASFPVQTYNLYKTMSNKVKNKMNKLITNKAMSK